MLSFPAIHNVGIFALFKFEIRKNIVVSHINLSSKHHTNLFSLEVKQNLQHRQFCVFRENSNISILRSQEGSLCLAF